MDAVIVEKIKKLLALSRSSNVNEAANAAAIANKYIAQYRINEADLIDQKTANKSVDQEYYPEKMYDDTSPIYESARVTSWKLQLACLLASHYGCAIWNDKAFGASKAGRSVSRFRLIGRYNDVQFAKTMFTWLVNEIQRLADTECRGMGHATLASYCKGAVKGIESLLEEGKRIAEVKAEQAGKSQALQRVDKRGEEATEYMYNKYNLIKVAPNKPRFDPEAFEKGYDIGNVIGRQVNDTE